MTTAHRPTFDHAKGKSNRVKSTIQHKRALAGQNELKFRKKRKTINEDFDSDPEEGSTQKGKKIDYVRKEDVEELKAELSSFATLKSETEGDETEDVTKSIDENNNEKETHIQASAESSDYQSSDYESSDEEEEDEEALLRQLEQIKQERANAKAKQHEEEVIERAKVSNPLMRIQPDILSDEKIQSESELKTQPKAEEKFGQNKVKRSWRSTNSFRRKSNQSGSNRFNNDMLKSDFHQQFMDRYIK